jgi:hypothetical protein
MYCMEINKNFVHQVGDQPRLYYDARLASHQDEVAIDVRGFFGRR